MDDRYKDSPILYRRRNEWDRGKILDTIKLLFKNVELIEGWKFVDCVSVIKKSARSEELRGHAFSVVKVLLLDPTEKEITYDIQIPELIENQFFYMGGHLKVPIFQIYDHPIIFRNNFLKLRNNIVSISVNMDRSTTTSFKTSIFGKTVPLDLLVATYHTEEEFIDFMSTRLNECDPLTSISSLCMSRWNESTQEDRIAALGSLFYMPGSDPIKKCKSILTSLKYAYNVDFLSKKFFKTDSLLFEILNAVYEGPKPDTSVRRKRVRFSEYVLAPLIRSVYDLLLTISGSRKVKFQIPQTIIMDSCNVSEIVHFNLAINPVSEINSFMQMSLTGPGGFKKSKVPSHLRNLDDTQFGYICGADTPDREGCGVVLNAVPTIDVKDNGDFGEADEGVITSYPISLIPFCEHDDPIRLQMASNQMKQALLLEHSEKPWIASGVEDCFLDETTFMYKARSDGKVVHYDSMFMIVVYEDHTSEIFNMSHRPLYLNVVDKLIPLVKEGDLFKEGDILCSSRVIDDGELKLGQNLLTAVTVWKGFNYEDGIVISESVRDKKFTSIHNVDLTFMIEPGQVLLSLDDDSYRPIPKVGDKLSKGEVCAKVKILDGEDGFESVNIEPFEVVAPINCEIVGIEIYPNSWNKKVSEFDLFIQETSIKQTDKFRAMEEKLIRYLPSKKEVDQFINVNRLSRLDSQKRRGKYSSKGKKFGGVMIKIHAIYTEKIGIGDKIANRHGNKGVISRIVPDNMMPVLEDGRRVEIILNPLGIISRMNVGQVYELHLNEALRKVKLKLKDISGVRNKTRFLKGFLDIIDKSTEGWTSKVTMKEYKSALAVKDKRAEDKIRLIQPPFQSLGPKEMLDAMEYAEAQTKYKLFDPTSGMNIANPIAVGYIYFLKLVHRASDKMSARSIGPYSKKTLQPLGGKSRLGGHRLGEMEVWSLMAHGADNLLHDFLTLQSDSPGLKNNFLAEVLQNPDLAASNTSDNKPQSLRLFETYLKILGLDLIN